MTKAKTKKEPDFFDDASEELAKKAANSEKEQE
jgi:hypothetical protein